MRKYFITGFAILLPLALTVAIVMFVVNLLTGPFLGLVKGVMEYYNILQKGFLFISGEQLQLLLSKILILLFLGFFTILIGILTRWFVINYLIKLGDKILHRIPFINTLYITFQDVFQTIFRSESSSFKQVVILPFPNRDSKTLGLVTCEEIAVSENDKRVAVFVPTTPNPTSGYLLMVKEDDLIYLDLSVEDALKYVISCGVILMPFKAISPKEAHQRIHEQVEAGE
ncbi:MAG: hypothetical protein K940chlam3_01152 [Chlamydiae bacterium]|nr:hypothetical protein [Chlamydiota bacterium]